MVKNGAEKSLFSKVDQIGVLVGDIDRATEYYESLGIGPFERPNRILIDRKVYGKPAGDVKNTSRSAMIGQIEFELVQPISGKSVQREFLEGKGEGINHLGSSADDVDKETDKWVKQGFNVISSGKYMGGGGFAYFDTDRVGGFQFEIFKWPPK